MPQNPQKSVTYFRKEITTSQPPICFLKTIFNEVIRKKIVKLAEKKTTAQTHQYITELVLSSFRRNIQLTDLSPWIEAILIVHRLAFKY